MKPYRSNIDRFTARIRGLTEAFRIDSQEVMDELGNAYVDVLKDRADNQSGPFGVRWEDNDPRYAARKGNLPVGVLSGVMLDPANLKVDATFANYRLYMRYAGSEEARQHLRWFEQGGRKLWGLDDQTQAAFHEVIRKHIHNTLRKK